MTSSKEEISTEQVLAAVRLTADRIGGCDPLWLKEGVVPNFETVEPLSVANPEIVLLHGLLGALSNWEAVLPELAKFSRPIALQLPILSGHRSEVKIKSLAAYAEFFVRTRNIQPTILCGNSLGGHVALRLCLASPHLVDCLILSGTSGLYEHTVDALPVRPDRKFIRDHMGRVFKGQSFISDQRVEEIYQILAKRSHVLNLIHAARSAKRDNLLKVLKDIKVPTLLLWGENDEVTTMQVARTFHENIKGSVLITKQNCGHAPMIEHPEWFAAEVKKFVSQHSRYFKSK